MFITLGPNSDYSKSAELIPSEISKESNHILKTRARDVHEQRYLSHLSIKAASCGQAVYETNNGRYLADASGYLIFNPEQSYLVCVDCHTYVEGIVVYLAAGFAEEVYRSLTTQTERLLDEPQMQRTASLEFVQRFYPKDNILSPLLAALQDSVNDARVELGWYEEQLHRVVRQLLRVHQKVRWEMISLPSLRAATREELYRRIYRARDYIAASIDQPLSISDMARAACLSPNHFMRTFKQVFRRSPHQYLTDLRLRRAMELLSQTSLPVTEISFLVGFESLSSFISLFHRRVGVPPGVYRQPKR